MDNSAADKAKKKYEAKRKIKSVPLLIDKEADLLAFADNLDDFANWVKDKIREELAKK
ncbi:hypothetical protein [Acinetobacter nosocomialis]|uniref:hypothetical protein n=1 Tax=Acinetobacter nosocomialis TaxID=106654 RepID=UPI0034E2861B